MTEFFGQEIQVLTISSPVGSVVDYAGDTAPTDWMLCQGQALSRSTYSALFAVLGVKFGSGDGSGTQFNLPDTRDRVTVGASATKVIASVGGAETVTHRHAAGTLQAPAHAHNMSNHAHGIPAHTHGTGGSNLATMGVAAGGQGPVSLHGHNHGATDGGTGGWTGGPNVADSASSGPFAISGEGADAAPSVMQPYMAFQKIIKVV